MSAAIERPDLIVSESVDIYENRDLAVKYGALSVPKTFINDVPTSDRLDPEENFMESVVKVRHVEFATPMGLDDTTKFDIAILGGGPAGLTAAIYAERSGLRSIIFERANVGGQVTISPVVENYPGFPRIAGKTLVDMMARQAMFYVPVLQGVGVKDIKKTDKDFEIKTTRGSYNVRGVIIATGAKYRMLNVSGERELSGRGVSYCATCDGYLYKDGKSVMVIGGGNTALTDALYLESIGARVTIVHRRDEFSAEDRLKQSVSQRKIEVLFNSRVVEILGKEIIETVKVEDVKNGKIRLLKIDAIFIAIGYEPNNDIAKKLGLEIDSEGYIKTDISQRTSIDHVYAAGDVTGGVKQITVAVGQGSIAAITAFDDLSKA